MCMCLLYLIQYINITFAYSCVGVNGVGFPPPGMLQSWNKFCFTGGALEMSIQLPGGSYSGGGGLWPAAWLMGNLARATFPASTLDVWPWSYDSCGSLPELQDKQAINACMESPGDGFNPFQGRGSPELDIFEVMPAHDMPGVEGLVRPFMSSSLQVSPGIDTDRPQNGQPLQPGQRW